MGNSDYFHGRACKPLGRGMPRGCRYYWHCKIMQRIAPWLATPCEIGDAEAGIEIAQAIDDPWITKTHEPLRKAYDPLHGLTALDEEPMTEEERERHRRVWTEGGYAA